jgi:phosphatidylglycerol lysyltransferase
MPLTRSTRSPLVIAATLATFGSGALNLYSLVHPALPSRLALLSRLLPLEFVALSRFMTLVVGFALVIASLNIYRRKRRALQAVVGLASLSIVFHLAKGVDYEEASLSGVLILLLIAGRHYFTVRSGLPDLKDTVFRLGGALLIGVAYGVAGFWLLDPREFGVTFSLREAIRQTLLCLALSGDPRLVPHTRHAIWFLESLSVMTGVMVLYGMTVLFRPVLYHLRTLPQERTAATEIARQHGRSSLDFFKLWPDKSLFFSPSRRSFLAYRGARGVALVLGDPVGPEEDIEPAVRDFSRFCVENDWDPAFYQTLPDFLPIYERCGFAKMKLGEDAIVDLRRFTLEGKGKRGLREAVRKVERQGIQVRQYDPPLSDELIAQLKSVSDDWLRIPGRRERQFTLGRFDPDYVRTSPILTATGADGVVHAFVNSIPSYRKGETTIDMMRRRGDAPNGVMDYLLAKLMFVSRDRGFERFSLGLAPMSGFAEREDATAEERAIHFFFQHLTFIFSFTGLRAYKAKFATDWEPRYIIHRNALDLPRVAMTLARVSEIR